MGTKYFIRRDEKVVASATLEEIKRHIANGRLLSSDELSNAMEGPWHNIQTVPELAALFGPQTTSTAGKNENWYYRIMGEEFGPESTRKLKQLMASGKIDPLTHIRRVGQEDWESAGNYPELSGRQGATPGPTPAIQFEHNSNHVDAPSDHPRKQKRTPPTRSMPTKKCRTCFSDIDIRAKRCPQCRKSQTGSRRIAIWAGSLLGVLAIGLFAFFGLSGLFGDSNSGDPIDILKELGATMEVDQAGHTTVVSLIHTPITDAGLENLEKLTSLQKLDLGGTPITDAGMKHIKGLTSLKIINLGATQITDSGIKQLKGLTNLEELNLSYVSLITDDGLEHLKGLTNLHELNLGSTLITDAGLVHLKGLANLQELNLGSTKVTDAGLVHLTGLKKLEGLSLRVTQVTDTGLEKLKRALPNCMTRH